MTTTRWYRLKSWASFVLTGALAVGLFGAVPAMFGGWWVEGPSTQQVLADLNESYANHTAADPIRRMFKIAQVEVKRTKRRGWSGNRIVMDIEMTIGVEPNATRDPSLRAGLAALREDGALSTKRAPLRLTYHRSPNNPDRDWSLVEIGRIPNRR